MNSVKLGHSCKILYASSTEAKSVNSIKLEYSCKILYASYTAAKSVNFNSYMFISYYQSNMLY